jgi:hypothetical protein
MAYYIFLKCSGSLEEFRKNPHVKIPPKSPCTNFHSPRKFKNLIFILKGIFLQFPAQSAQSACLAFPPTRPTRPLLPPSPVPTESHHLHAPSRPGRCAALLPHHGESPMVTPPLQSAVIAPVLHSGNGSIEDTIYHRRPTYSGRLCHPIIMMIILILLVWRI